ncbi:MAG: HEAT repeat domain-containing protein [Planctomycetota bacterium]
MRLLELCLTSLLSPQAPGLPPTTTVPPAASAPSAQEPAPTPPAPATGPATSATTPTETTGATGNAPAAPSTPTSPDAASAQNGEGEQLVQRTLGEDPLDASAAVAELAKAKKGAANPFLQRVVAESRHADARTAAMQALLRSADVGVTSTAIRALEDDDRRVRTLAAQTLGKLRRPTAVEPLLQLLDRTRKPADPTTNTTIATDVQAALLALHDLGAADKLLRAATAVHDGQANGAGEALAYCLQELSRQLPRAEEQTLLLAVLDHREPLVRRFAIGRLAELDATSAISALERRLATETDSLRPLVEAALVQLRRDTMQQPTDELARARQNATLLWHKAKAWWLAATPTEQGVAAGTPVLLLLVVGLLRRRRARAAATAEAAAMTALVAPSEEYAEQVAAEAAELVAAAEEVALQEEVASDDTGVGDEAAATEGDGMTADGAWIDAAPDATTEQAEVAEGDWQATTEQPTDR